MAWSRIASLQREALTVSCPGRGAAPLSRDPKLRKQPHAK
jgi:hypothetical protein